MKIRAVRYNLYLNSKISFFLLICLFSIFQTGCNWIGPQKACAKRFKAYVRYVIDGDTIVLRNGEKVRYLGINAPEIAHYNQTAQPFGLAAKKFNKSLVFHKIVIIDTAGFGRDQYGRLLGFVFLRNGTLVNLLLVKKGLAYCDLTYDLPFKNKFIKLQRIAMKKRIGIWSLPIRNPDPYYIGNKRSMRFHRPWCPLGRQTSRRNRIIFKSAWDAYWDGYFPCKKCNP